MGFPKPFGLEDLTPRSASKNNGPTAKGPLSQPPSLLQNISAMGLGSGGAQRPAKVAMSLDPLFQQLHDHRKAVRVAALDRLGRLAPKMDLSNVEKDEVYQAVCERLDD